MSNIKSSPTCPHCKYEFDSDETWHSTYSEYSQVYNGDGDESEVKCHNDDCGKKFKITCDHVPMYISEEIEDEDDE